MNLNFNLDLDLESESELELDLNLNLNLGSDLGLRGCSAVYHPVRLVGQLGKAGGQ